MRIELDAKSTAITLRDRLQLRQRAAHLLRKIQAWIEGISVKVSVRASAALAEERFCEIHAHLEDGTRMSATARGGDALVAIDRALRRLARAIVTRRKRADSVRALRALMQST